MNPEEVFKMIGVITVAFAIIYYFGQCMSLQTTIIEGLENKDAASTTTTTTTTSSGGLAGGASASIDAIKAETVKIQDELLTDKYKADYEKKIIALDDYLDTLMLKTTLSFTPASGSGLSVIISQLAAMKSARDALNDVMKTLDKGSTSII